MKVQGSMCVQISWQRAHHNNKVSLIRFMCSCEWCDCHLQWSLLFFNVNSDPPPPTFVPAPSQPQSNPLQQAISTISITPLWAFSFCGGGKLCVGRKQLHSLSTCRCFQQHNIYGLFFFLIKSQRKPENRICDASAPPLLWFTFVPLPFRPCASMQNCPAETWSTAYHIPAVLFWSRTRPTSQIEMSPSQFIRTERPRNPH